MESILTTYRQALKFHFDCFRQRETSGNFAMRFYLYGELEVLSNKSKALVGIAQKHGDEVDNILKNRFGDVDKD